MESMYEVKTQSGELVGHFEAEDENIACLVAHEETGIGVHQLVAEEI